MVTGHIGNGKIKAFTALLLTALLMMCLAGCSKKVTKTTTSSPDAANTAVTTVAESTTETEKATEAPAESTTLAEKPDQTENAVEQSLRSTLNVSIEYGPGEAGSMLDNASTAVAFVQWAEKNHASEMPLDKLVDAVYKWYDHCSMVQQEMFRGNWTTINADGDDLFYDYDSIRDDVEDAGCADEAEAAAAAENGQADWGALQNAIETAIDKGI